VGPDADAATGTEDVPDLLGKNQADAEAAMAKTSLKLQIDTAHTPQNASATITDQIPAGNSTVRKGATVLVRF
jgi:beta-lactam-binding protein with PASTA domain